MPCVAQSVCKTLPGQLSASSYSYGVTVHVDCDMDKIRGHSMAKARYVERERFYKLYELESFPAIDAKRGSEVAQHVPGITFALLQWQ